MLFIEVVVCDLYPCSVGIDPIEMCIRDSFQSFHQLIQLLHFFCVAIYHIRSTAQMCIRDRPWFTEGSLQWPRNLSGREYNGKNAIMLTLHCEKEGYTNPRFCTFDCLQRLNKPGKNGEELSSVSVPKREKSFPVMLTTFTCICLLYTSRCV